MTTRYQSKHYEDVAEILYEWTRTRTESGHNPTECSECINVALICADFADLFATHDPPICITCGVPHSPSHGGKGTHNFISGFDRKWFLAACGLESEG
ncbi:hypothetical protein LCGC14_2049860 [marine sediment metagenome]|uniref:Uncharacterized protein n=1 Tax=marine sediment metagenome TaxID=412755 RepID=A0A0F9FBV2_9ZZZZ